MNDQAGVQAYLYTGLINWDKMEYLHLSQGFSIYGPCTFPVTVWKILKQYQKTELLMSSVFDSNYLF
jgi:hypothetical protein